MYDTIIIGAGPAGLTAAIYLKRANKNVLLIEKEGIGGQIASSPLVENYPGFKAISGAELANNLYEQVDNLGCEIAIEEVLEITKDKKVITDSNEYETKSIIIATGCEYRRLNLENEEDFIGSGIHFCVSCDGAFYNKKVVGVIGGGNSALINALSLSELAEKVVIVQDLDHLTGEEKYINEITKKSNVEINLSSKVTKYLSENGKFSGIEINGERNIKLDGIFLSIGRIPTSKMFKNLIDIDDYGYIKSADMNTNLDGIFVAGDVRTKSVRQLTTATNDGTIAAINAIDYLNNKNL